MIKAMLVINMPETCRECPLWERKYFPTSGDCGTDYCHAGVIHRLDIDIYSGKPIDCRLIPASGYLDEHGNLISWGGWGMSVTKKVRGESEINLEYQVQKRKTEELYERDKAKKVIWDDVSPLSDDYIFALCPNCGVLIQVRDWTDRAAHNHYFCTYCGQRLKWED